MPIISVRDHENNRWKRKGKKHRPKETKGWQSYSGSVSAKWFCSGFKLGFVQLMRKASLVFKSNLELVLSIILKERELSMSKHAVVECRCLKIWDLVILFDMFLNPSFKMTASFAHVVRSAARASKFIY